MRYFAAVYVLALAVMSLVTFIAYGADKRRAQSGDRRIPEKSLHWLAFLGGWPGALAGQRVFRHKTQKLSFRIAFWLVFVLHCILVLGIVYSIRGLE